ncbi:MAG TPA: hypothetical protein VIS99_11260 [Terrimicrobiaceae bacterium]
MSNIATSEEAERAGSSGKEKHLTAIVEQTQEIVSRSLGGK